MSNLPLHPAPFGYIIYCILPLVAIAQWIVIIRLALNNSVWDSLEGVTAAKNATYKRAFINDGFFLIWNITPIFLLATYAYISINWPNWEADLLLLNRDELVDAYWATYSFRFNIATLLIITIAAVAAVAIQLAKQNSFIKQRTYIYWWDTRISKTIFWIRLIALFFNMFAVLYTTLAIVSLSYFMLKAIKIANLNLTFFHPDSTGGLGVFGDMSIVMASGYLFISGIGLVAIFDHGFRQGFWHNVSDLSALFCLIPALVILLYPATVNRDRLITTFNPLNKQIEQLLYKEIPTELHNILNPPSSSTDDESKQQRALSVWLQARSHHIRMLQVVLSIRYFPLSIGTFLSLVASWLVPLFVWASFRLVSSKTS
ncbi:MAG: hypothetical protein AB7E47_10100 [Desulfovibrionaceae bacterium]